MNEGVVGVGLSSSKSNALIGVEWASELVTVDYTEHTSVELDINSDAEILPCVSLNAAWFWDEVTFQKDALGNAGVLDTWFNDVQSWVFQVVVDGAFTNTIVLVGVFNDGLLEVGAEVKYLWKFRKVQDWELKRALN